MWRRLTLLAVCLTLGACASAPPTAHPGSAPVSPGHNAAGTASGPTAAGNKQKSEAEASRLLGLAELPQAAHPASRHPQALDGPALGVAATSSLIDRTQFWSVPLGLAPALAWIKAHRPGGLRPVGSAGSSGPDGVQAQGLGYGDPRASTAWEQAMLEFTVAPAGAGHTYWRVDGMAIWLDPRPLPDSARVVRIHVGPDIGCPAADRGVGGVRNTGTGLATALLPAGPISQALLCRYGGLNRPPFRLLAHRQLPGAAARRLAALVRGISLSHADNELHGCPADFGGAVVLAFRYASGRTVDLWYHDSGCVSVANGTIRAGAVTDPFSTAVRRAVGG